MDDNEIREVNMVWFNHAFLWLKSRNNTKQQEEMQQEEIH